MLCLPFLLPCYLINISDVGLNLKITGTQGQHLSMTRKKVTEKSKEKDIIRVLILAILCQLNTPRKYIRKDIFVAH